MVAARCACELPLITVSEGRPGTQRRVSPCSPHTYQTSLHALSLSHTHTLFYSHTCHNSHYKLHTDHTVECREKREGGRGVPRVY